MVKNWDLQRKYNFFVSLTNIIAENKSSIPSLKLFKNLIKDQKEKSAYTYNSSPLRNNLNQSSEE